MPRDTPDARNGTTGGGRVATLSPVPRTILLDCDPGQDDAVALLLAWGNPEIELAAVTTIGGNQTLAKVTRNALGVAAVAGITGVTFAAGCDRPLIAPLRAAGEIHGENGMGGIELPLPGFALDPRHAVDVIIDEVMSRPRDELTLVPTGPLTNIAMAARKEPRIVERVREVVLMGGGYHTGNITPTAEFNVWTDPEAAKIVFTAGWPVTMVGLDLTHQALATNEVEARVAAIRTPVADFVVDLFGVFRAAYRANRAFEHPPVHDPCTVAYCIDPSVMTVHRAPIDVELTGELTRGMTVTDLRGHAPADCVTQVGVRLDVDKFWNLVIDAVRRCG